MRWIGSTNTQNLLFALSAGVLSAGAVSAQTVKPAPPKPAVPAKVAVPATVKPAPSVLTKPSVPTPQPQQRQVPPTPQQRQVPPTQQQGQGPLTQQRGQVPPLQQQKQSLPPQQQKGQIPPLQQQKQGPPMQQKGQVPPMPPRGVERTPVPPPRVPAGYVVHNEPGKGYRVEGPNGTEIHHENLTAHLRTDGHPQVFDRRVEGGRQTYHEVPGRGRVFVTERQVPGGYSRVEAYGPHRGSFLAPMPNHPGFERHTYLAGDRRYAVLYREHHYGEVAFYRPVRAVYYRPEYYRWATSPWQAPISIQVGFVSQPWYAAYPGAFVPYPVYARPDQWMTDQILAGNMQAAYEAGREAQAQQQGAQALQAVAPPEITPELKSQIDAQVRYDIQEQAQQVQQGIGKTVPPDLPPGAAEPEELPDSLKPYHMLFRVFTPLTVQVDGHDCTLSPDVWVVRTSNLNADYTVSVKVLTSQASDCPKATTTQVTLSELQAMQNDLSEHESQGLEMMAKSMGKDGIPMGADAGATIVAGAQVPPDENAAKALQLAQQESATAQQQVTAAARAGGS